jgi:hypothetical protein
MKTWYLNNEDIHLNVCKLIARTVQTLKVPMPKHPLAPVGLFLGKHWDSYTKDDYERQISKNTVHGNNYGLGPRKFALMVGLSEAVATTIQGIYHGLFPEIKNNYQAKIRIALQRDRTIVLPEPLGWTRVFYDAESEDLYRAAYAALPQSTIGGKLVRLWDRMCRVFDEELPEGELATPSRILQMGYDVRLNSHDSLAILVPDDPDTILHICRTIKRYGEEPLVINGEACVIPMDFKTGPNLYDLTKYKLEEA